jgi:hypothetical protein
MVVHCLTTEVREPACRIGAVKRHLGKWRQDGAQESGPLHSPSPIRVGLNRDLTHITNVPGQEAGPRPAPTFRLRAAPTRDAVRQPAEWQ